jgi:hypothetical protein
MSEMSYWSAHTGVFLFLTLWLEINVGWLPGAGLCWPFRLICLTVSRNGIGSLPVRHWGGQSDTSSITAPPPAMPVN